MSELESSSSNVESKESVATSSLADAASSVLKNWEALDQRTGTGCKCGAHTSASWEKGGREWLLQHVASVHAEAFDWLAAVKKALTFTDPKEGMDYLALIIDHEENKETLGNA